MKNKNPLTSSVKDGIIFSHQLSQCVTEQVLLAILLAAATAGGAFYEPTHKAWFLTASLFFFDAMIYQLLFGFSTVKDKKTVSRHATLYTYLYLMFLILFLYLVALVVLPQLISLIVQPQSP